MTSAGLWFMSWTPYALVVLLSSAGTNIRARIFGTQGTILLNFIKSLKTNPND